jgi:hypothetical protein
MRFTQVALTMIAVALHFSIQAKKNGEDAFSAASGWLYASTFLEESTKL